MFREKYLEGVWLLPYSGATKSMAAWAKYVSGQQANEPVRSIILQPDLPKKSYLPGQLPFTFGRPRPSMVSKADITARSLSLSLGML